MTRFADDAAAAHFGIVQPMLSGQPAGIKPDREHPRFGDLGKRFTKRHRHRRKTAIEANCPDWTGP